MSGVLGIASRLWGAGWELRRRAYAAGLRRPRRVPARVVSIGNLTVGGTGKTTLVLHLARLAVERGIDAAVVCRRYHPGPDGRGDEELLYREALDRSPPDPAAPDGVTRRVGGPSRVHAGRDKTSLAARAAVEGRALVLVDDAFSHWRLERDLDVVLIDATEPWGGGRLLPAGRLREPLRALPRAEMVVVSRVPAGVDPGPLLAEVARVAPAARRGAARHRVVGLRALDGRPCPREGAFRVVTATGNPAAVERSAAEAGLAVAFSARYRDHHWFTPGEARREHAAAEREDARLLLTAKDAVRWPAGAPRERVCVLEVAWEWLPGSAGLDDLVLGVPGAR